MARGSASSYREWASALLLQRPRPLRGGADRGRAGERRHAGAGPAAVGAGRARSRRRSGAGMPDRGADALERLTAMTRASGTDWALGLEARVAGAAERRATPPSGSTGRRSSGSAAPASAPSSRAHTCSTASGCVGSAGGWMRASSCAWRTRCSRRWGWRRSPSGRGASCGRRGRRRGGGAGGERRVDGAGGRRSRGWRGRVCRIRRSGRGCSSARARSSTTCTRSSPSSTSARAASSTTPSPTPPRRPGPRPIGRGYRAIGAAYRAHCGLSVDSDGRCPVTELGRSCAGGAGSSAS